MITIDITWHVGVGGMMGYEKIKMTWKDGADVPYVKSDMTLNIGVQVYLFKK